MKMPALIAQLLPLLPLVVALHTQTLSGYSRVVNQNTIDTNALLLSAPLPPVIAVAVSVDPLLSSSEERNDESLLPIAAAILGRSEESPPLAKSLSLATFMRENLQAGQSALATMAGDGASQGGSQSAMGTLRLASQSASRRQDELSSLMKKRLAAFVRKFMKAEIHEVRVERRQNGIIT